MKKPLLFRCLALVFALALLCSTAAMAETAAASGGKYNISMDTVKDADGGTAYLANVRNGSNPVTNLILYFVWSWTKEDGTSFSFAYHTEYSETTKAYRLGVPDYMGLKPDYTLIIAAEEKKEGSAFYDQLDRIEKGINNHEYGVAQANANNLGYALFK